jgi:hypothetical protein
MTKKELQEIHHKLSILQHAAACLPSVFKTDMLVKRIRYDDFNQHPPAQRYVEQN